MREKQQCWPEMVRTRFVIFFFLNIFFWHISSSFAKILGETNVNTREIPEVGQKQKTEKKKEKREKERRRRANNGDQGVVKI